MEDERAAHSEDPTEKASLEDDIVSRGSLTGFRGRGCGHAGCRPIVPSERERREVDFMRKLDEAGQCGGAANKNHGPVSIVIHGSWIWTM
jgi:hypothetical protein